MQTRRLLAHGSCPVAQGQSDACIWGREGILPHGQTHMNREGFAFLCRGGPALCLGSLGYVFTNSAAAVPPALPTAGLVLCLRTCQGRLCSCAKGSNADLSGMDRIGLTLPQAGVGLDATSGGPFLDGLHDSYTAHQRKHFPLNSAQQGH